MAGKVNRISPIDLNRVTKTRVPGCAKDLAFTAGDFSVMLVNKVVLAPVNLSGRRKKGNQKLMEPI